MGRLSFLFQVWLHRLKTTAAILWRLRSKYKNWGDFLLSRFRQGRTILELRDGTKVEIRNHGQDRAHVSECLVLGAYDGDPNYQIAETDVVLDVGANIGAFTIRAASLAKKGRVISVEPQADNFQILEGNIRRNGFKNVQAIRCALSGSDGEASLGVGVNHCPSLVFGQTGMKVETVQTLTLASFLKRVGVAEVDLMKMDCEGAEFDILLGASRVDLRKIRRVVMEYHNAANDRTYRELTQCFEKAGFKVECLLGHWNGILKATRQG